NKILIYLLIGRGVIAIPELYFALTYNETASLELFLSDIAAALFFGVFFLVSFLITKGGLGMGDVKYIIIAGLYAGMPITFLAIIIGLTLSFFISIYALSTKKLERTSALPMIPFLAAGQVLATILNISGIVG
ncbi:MAG: hypothetical protein LBN03_01685, partial [Bifidobacteriaceae bacterium]|nr:hypothetical protein [Bifidobacteriaceae bacterium]